MELTEKDHELIETITGYLKSDSEKVHVLMMLLLRDFKNLNPDGFRDFVIELTQEAGLKISQLEDDSYICSMCNEVVHTFKVKDLEDVEKDDPKVVCFSCYQKSIGDTSEFQLGQGDD